MALCRRYGLRPYREVGRRYSTVLLRAPKTFHERTLWPEFLALSAELDAHLQELTDRVIREAIDEDVSEASDAEPAKELTDGATAEPASAGSEESAGGTEPSPT